MRKKRKCEIRMKLGAEKVVPVLQHLCAVRKRVLLAAEYPVLSTTELTIILNATIIEETKVSSEFLLAGNYRVIKNSNRKFE